MGVLFIIYRLIVGIICILTLWELIKEESFSRALSLGLVSIPLVLRTLMIK